MGASQKTIPLKNEFAEIERLANIVNEFCSEHDVPSEFLYPLNVVLDEMVTNVISYAWDDGADHEFYVHLDIEGGHFIAIVEDDGKPFDPLTKEEVDTTKSIEDRPIGGLGIHFAREMMDGIEYEYKDHKNVLTLKKRIHP